MSSTRHATGGPLRQERFASSQEFERGLMANLVAKRCSLLECAENRELVWFLQLLSHEEGGLKNVARELCERFPDRLATPAMRQIGMKPGQKYNASQVQKVRAEIPGAEFDFPLKGEMDVAGAVNVPDGPRDSVDNWAGDWKKERAERLAALESAADKHPSKYPAEVFAQRCQRAAVAELERHLGELCLDPDRVLTDGEPWYFPTLISTLRAYQAAWIAARRPAAVTSIGREVAEALDYALESGRLVLIDGPSRIGKTFAAKAWCEQAPGRARYVQVPSNNDEIGFYRAIARSLGVSINLNSKAQELRQRIEDTVRDGHLAIVFDEAHYLWPQSLYRHALPGRINWVMTALVNQGGPVALVTTPQFLRSQKQVEARTGWTSEQFIGRIGHYQKLSESLTADDLKAVARAFIPYADARSIEALVSYAQMSAKYLAGIEAVAVRAQFIMRRAGRQKVEFKDVMRAIDESVIPSDSAFAAAMNSVGKPARKRAVTVPATTPTPRSARPLVPVLAQHGRGVRPAGTSGNVTEELHEAVV